MIQRRPRDRSGRFWSRLVGVGDDPISWSFPIAKLSRIQLRVHVIWPAFILAELLWSLPANRLGPQFVGLLLAGLLIAVVVRESARLLVRTTLGNRPDRVIYGPIGEWSIAGPDRADLLVASSGFLATVVLALVSASTLVLLGAPRIAEVFSPLTLHVALATLTPTQLPIWAIYAGSIALLFVHLLPAYPLDAGRVLAVGLAGKRDPESARRLAGTIGGVTGAVVALGGLVSGQVLVLALGGVLVWTSLSARRAAAFLLAPEQDLWLHPSAGPKTSPEELDQLLEKISQTGIESLSRHERSVLDRASNSDNPRAS